MNARITILSGHTEAGEKLGCTGNQLYAAIYDLSAKDAAGYDLKLFCTTACDTPEEAREQCGAWAAANGVEINGDHRPRAYTGGSADYRANTRRW